MIMSVMDRQLPQLRHRVSFLFWLLWLLGAIYHNCIIAMIHFITTFPSCYYCLWIQSYLSWMKLILCAQTRIQQILFYQYLLFQSIQLLLHNIIYNFPLFFIFLSFRFVLLDLGLARLQLWECNLIKSRQHIMIYWILKARQKFLPFLSLVAFKTLIGCLSIGQQQHINWFYILIVVFWASSLILAPKRRPLFLCPIEQ